MQVFKLVSRIALTACIASLCAVGAWAQGPGRGPGGGGRGMGMGMGGGGLTGLLMMEEVQKELKLDEDQLAELKEIQTAMRESFAGMRPQGGGGAPDPQAMQAMMEKMRKAAEEAEGKLEDILDPKQLERLIGLVIQRDNLRSLNSKLVAAKLNITDEQKAKMAELEKENQEKMQEMFQGGFGPEMRDKMRTLREEGETKLKALLTDAQKEQMESLKGPEFKFPEGRGGPGGPGGGRGRRGGGGGSDGN